MKVLNIVMTEAQVQLPDVNVLRATFVGKLGNAGNITIEPMGQTGIVAEILDAGDSFDFNSPFNLKDYSAASTEADDVLIIRYA